MGTDRAWFMQFRSVEWSWKILNPPKDEIVCHVLMNSTPNFARFQSKIGHYIFITWNWYAILWPNKSTTGTPNTKIPSLVTEISMIVDLQSYFAWLNSRFIVEKTAAIHNCRSNQHFLSSEIPVFVGEIHSFFQFVGKIRMNSLCLVQFLREKSSENPNFSPFFPSCPGGPPKVLQPHITALHFDAPGATWAMWNGIRYENVEFWFHRNLIRFNGDFIGYLYVYVCNGDVTKENDTSADMQIWPRYPQAAETVNWPRNFRLSQKKSGCYQQNSHFTKTNLDVTKKNQTWAANKLWMCVPKEMTRNWD